MIVFRFIHPQSCCGDGHYTSLMMFLSGVLIDLRMVHTSGNGVFGELPVPSVFLGAYTSPVFLFWCGFVYFVKRIVGNPKDLSRER